MKTPRISVREPAGRGSDLITAALEVEDRKYFVLADGAEPSGGLARPSEIG
jgi:hypothetical protein